MANIKVDHSQFEKTAKAIETYVSQNKSKMKTIDSSVTTLSGSWQGTDYTQLTKEWKEINGTDSTTDKMLKSLENYAELLRFAANKYKKAQADAINRANSLPKY